MDFDRKRQKDLERIQNYRLIDDTFMTVVFKDKACSQLLINRVLQRDDLKIIEVHTQDDLKNLWGRSVRLDILAIDSENVLYNIEVQRADKGASRKRARYNSSRMDSNVTEPGDEYEKLPETFVIFITENDYLGKQLPLYHVERVVQETGELFNDKEHIIYVNGQYRGNDPIGDLMHDFFCKNPDDMSNKLLAQSVRYYKTEEEGVSQMCKISEEIRNEGIEEGMAKIVKGMMTSKGISFDQACDEANLSQGDREAVKKFLQ